MFKIEENKVVYYVESKPLAYVSYPFVANNMVNIDHTVVDPSLQGQGIASKLLDEAYKDIKEKGYQAQLTCSYAIRWFEKHPECHDVLANGIRKYQKEDFYELYNLTKNQWENEVPMSSSLANFIYDFLVRYYLYNNEYSYVGLVEGKLKAFLLANLKDEENDAEAYFKANLNGLTEDDKKKAYEYLDYINYNHRKVLSHMSQNSIYLGLIASRIHGMGIKLIEKLKLDALKNNVHEIYLWTDETCNYEYYEKLSFNLIEEYIITLYGKEIKTFIYKTIF